jgi:hypothetical protein
MSTSAMLNAIQFDGSNWVDWKGLFMSHVLSEPNARLIVERKAVRTGSTEHAALLVKLEGAQEEDDEGRLERVAAAQGALVILSQEDYNKANVWLYQQLVLANAKHKTGLKYLRREALLGDGRAAWTIMLDKFERDTTARELSLRRSISKMKFKLEDDFDVFYDEFNIVLDQLSSIGHALEVRQSK